MITAQKMNFLLNHGYKHLAAPRGTQHVGIEEAIQASEDERLNFLKRLKPVLLKVTELETVFKINQYEARGNQWNLKQTIEEPNLKALASK